MVMMTSRLSGALIINLFIFSVFHFIYHEPISFPDKIMEYRLVKFTLAFRAPIQGICSSGLPKKSKSTTMTPAGIKLALKAQSLSISL